MEMGGELLDFIFSDSKKQKKTKPGWHWNKEILAAWEKNYNKSKQNFNAEPLHCWQRYILLRIWFFKF